MRKVVFAMRLWVRCYWGGQCLCFQTFDTNVGRTKFTTLTINHIALIDIFLFGWTWEISRKKSRAWPGKRRETFPFFWSIFQWTYPFTDGRIVAVPLWYPLHHWHHGLQVPLAPRWCHLHCTCLRPWRNGDGNNGNCLSSTLGMKRICKITIVLANLLMRWLFVYVKKYEEEFCLFMSESIWVGISGVWWFFCKPFAAITEVTPLLSRCTFTSFAYRESVKTPRAVVAQV